MRPWMGRVVDFFHSSGCQVGIYLCRTERLVSEQFLYATQIRTIVEQMGCEAMTKGMGTDPRIQPGDGEIFVEFSSDRPRAKRLTVLVQEHLMGVLGIHPAVSLSSGKISLQGQDGLRTDGGESVFAPLATNPQNTFGQVDILHFQVHQFADSDARAVKYFEHGFIADTEDIPFAWRIEKLLHLFQVQTFGKSPFLLRGSDGGQRIDRKLSASDQKLVEGPEGGQFSSRCALGVILSSQIRKELANRQGFTSKELGIERFFRGSDPFGVAKRGSDLSTEELPELEQIGTIRANGVIAEMPFELEIIEKRANQRTKVFGFGHIR